MQNSGKRASIYLGIFLAIVMGAGAILPLLSPNGATPTTVEPTATVLPTFPPPPSDLSAITFDRVYLHPSGVFAIGEPEGWTASEPNKGPTIAQVNLINNQQLAVVDSYVETTGTPISTAELTDHFTEAAIRASWSNFTTWEETSRVTEDDRLVIDFSVTLQGRTFVARQVAWTDGTWIYVVRVLVPANATDYLRYLLDGFVASFDPLTQFQGTPLEWNSYYDPTENHIIRYPADWQVTDSAPGRPTSITSSDGILLRVEAREGVTIADETAAVEYVESERSGISVTSIEQVTRGLAEGFSAAYSYTTVDGDTESGLAVLLTDADGTLHTANMRFPSANVDLNADAAATPEAEATSEASAATVEAPSADQQLATTLAQVMNTFTVIEPLNLSPELLPATPTPLPTVAPVSEATPEVTVEEVPEATAEPTAEVTDAP